MAIKKWKKNLYENVGYPDNYTDVTFLKELRKNVNIQELTFKDAILGAGLVTRELSVVVLFSLLFMYLYNEWVEPETVFVQSCLLTTVGYLVYRILIITNMSYKMLVMDFRTVVIFLVFGYFLSPILKTLTDTISTDTIYATTAFMMCVHLIFFDYGVTAAIVSSSLSLNAAIFGSVCLASRLSSPFHAFVLLTVAVQSFALLPLLLAKIRDSILVLFALVGITLYFLSSTSITIFFLFGCAVIFITLLCPVWFLWWQRYKENIYGPWDEAIVHDTDM